MLCRSDAAQLRAERPSSSTVRLEPVLEAIASFTYSFEVRKREFIASMLVGVQSNAYEYDCPGTHGDGLTIMNVQVLSAPKIVCFERAI